MEFQVNTNQVILRQQDQVESGEYNVTECNFTFTNEYDGLTKKAVFTGEDGTAYLETIVDNKCSIPSEILEVSQVVEIGVYAYAVENEELILRYSPEPTDFFIHEGSYKDAQNSTPPTPSEIEQLQSQITTNANDIEELTGDVVDINQDIADIKAEQITQNENIQTNANNISTINEQISDINETITNLETNKANVTDLNALTERVSTNERDIDTIDGHISDINQNIDDLEQDLTNYSLITETGSQINLNVNSTNYQITAILKDKNGNVIYTSNAIDLPIESMIVNASYDNTTKEIVLTLQNGTTLRFSVADLVSGLVSTDQLTQILSNYYNKNEVDALIPDLTDYVKNTDYATYNKGGVIKSGNGFGVYSTGFPYGSVLSKNDYDNQPNYFFISKGTLENVITGKELINQTQLEESQATQDTEIETLQANKMDKSDIPSIDNLTNYYKKSETYNKTEIDGKVSSVYKYKGTVATYQDLPSTDLTIGDVYNVEEDGSNYAWTGNGWDKLGGDIDLSEYYTKTQTDSLLSAKANSSDVYTKSETYNKTEVNTLLDGKVDKVQGKGLSSNDFTDNDKNQIEANQNAIAGIKNGTTINDFGAVETALENKEDKSNKVTELTDQSTDVEYPSAKCVYDELEAKQSEIDTLQQDVEDLRGACLSVEGTGTDITLNNTAQARLLKNELSGRTEQTQLTGSNQFNASAIANSDIQVLDNGKTIKLPIVTTGNGYTSTSTRFYNLCPNVKIGDVLYLYFTRSQELQASNLIYFEQAGVTWLNNTSIEITEEMLNSLLIVYGNRASSGETEQISLTDFRIVKTQNAPFEQFCGGIPSPNPDYSQQIKNVTGQANVKIQNKNLLPNNATSQTINGIQVVINNDKSITLNGTTTAHTRIYLFQDENILIKTGNYKASTHKSGTISGGNSYFDFVFSNVGTKSIYNNTQDNMGISILEDDILTGASILFGNGVTLNNFTLFPMLEQGSTATSYVPHQEQNYPFTFASGQFLADDEELQDNGRYKEWEKIILDGTQDIQTVNWRPSETSVGWIYPYDLTSNKNNYSNTDIPDILCNKLIRKTYSQLYNKVDEGIGLVPSTAGIAGIVVRISNPNLTTKEAINSYLAQNPLTVIYKKAQPYTIPYNSTQASQYEAIKNARSYDDITYITSESDELGFDMNVVAIADANKVIDSELQEIKSAVIALGGDLNV